MTVNKDLPEIWRLLERYKGHRTTPYPYYDATEKLVGCVIRIDTTQGKEIKQHSYSADTGEWAPNAVPVPRPLYNLPALIAEPHKPVLIVEGEKAADAAMLIPELSGFIVVTWSGGANNYHKADWTPLDGRNEILIWPDNDEPGLSAAKGIAKILFERNRK